MNCDVHKVPPLSRTSWTSLFTLPLSPSMQPEPPISDTTLHLRRDTAAHSSAVTVPLSSGVDIGLVGRVLGLDPATLRLNGYYVSRSGPGYVSGGLLWGQLLGFFAQRGLPCGGTARGAIVVQGKHIGSTGGNPLLKRRFCLESECLHKKRKAEISYDRSKYETISTKRNLEFRVETERHSKNRKLEENCKLNGNSAAKRSVSVNSNGDGITSKKLKIPYSLSGTQKSYTASTSHLPIWFRLCSSVGFCRASRLNYTITVSLSSSVNLGLVGRVLGLDPKTVRLNGYYVSRIGPQYVSPALTWGSLLDFFARKRLPCGCGLQEAMVVKGKYVGPADENKHLKRKVGSENGCALKKRRLPNQKSDESVIHLMKRTMNSNEIQDPLKRLKVAYSSSMKTDTILCAPHVSKLSVVV